MIITWMADGTGRFPKRPFFSLEGMDRHCERIVQGHNGKLYGQPVPGLRTDALLRMLNDYAALHLYEDLSKYGAGVEAVTGLVTGKKPTVRVARELFFDRSQNNHLRFVLAHELAHARFHAAAWRRRWMRETVGHPSTAGFASAPPNQVFRERYAFDPSKCRYPPPGWLALDVARGQ